VSKNRRDLTLEERSLWRRVASTVKARRPAQDHHEPEPASKAPSRRSGAHEPPARVTPPSRPAASRPLQNRAAEKRVKRGDIEIGATLDLHGHTQDSAVAALTRFLHRAQQRGDRAVIVVTGVGRGGEGVLKRMFPGWLAAKDIRPLVAGYAPAHRSHGGAGAFYVFIKRPRD
jgi:DNA-nicking Smr family endonuclease